MTRKQKTAATNRETSHIKTVRQSVYLVFSLTEKTLGTATHPVGRMASIKRSSVKGKSWACEDAMHEARGECETKKKKQGKESKVDTR